MNTQISGTACQELSAVVQYIPSYTTLTTCLLLINNFCTMAHNHNNRVILPAVAFDLFHLLHGQFLNLKDVVLLFLYMNLWVLGRTSFWLPSLTLLPPLTWKIPASFLSNLEQESLISPPSSRRVNHCLGDRHYLQSAPKKVHRKFTRNSHEKGDLWWSKDKKC